MTKRTKSANDAPPIAMRFENGRLVPLSAFDDERLASYSKRPVLFFHVEAAPHPARRKLEAIIAKVIKMGNTPFTTRDAMLDVIKLELMCVTVTKRAGKTHVEPASLSSLDDEDFLEFYDGAMAKIQLWTGVDPETLGREANDTGSYQYQTSSAPPPSPGADDEGDDAPPQSSSPASSASDGGSSADGERPEQSDSSSADVPFNGPLALECIRKLLAIALDKAVPDAKDRQDILKGAKENWKGKVPNEFLRKLVDYINKFIIGKATEADTRRMIGTLLP